jgi:hypothetical protein
LALRAKRTERSDNRIESPRVEEWAQSESETLGACRLKTVLVVRDHVFVSVDHRVQVALGPHKFSLALAKISLAFLFCAE